MPTDESSAAEANRDAWEARAAGWLRDAATFDVAFAEVTASLAPAMEGARRVLDVGCGAGTLLELAVAAGAEAVGIDIAAPMAEAASRRVPAATVLNDDAQTADIAALAPGDPFDRVVSRFGVMFFADPTAAFANLRSAAAPGATLDFVCWRAEEADAFVRGLAPLASAVDVPLDPPKVGAPGPLGLGHRDRIDAVLAAAGWVDATVEPLDIVCTYGTDGSDGVEERLAVVTNGPVGRAIVQRVLEQRGQVELGRLLEDARQDLRTSIVGTSVQIRGRCWRVHADND